VQPLVYKNACVRSPLTEDAISHDEHKTKCGGKVVWWASFETSFSGLGALLINSYLIVAKQALHALP
jgi:hypothetical protein